MGQSTSPCSNCGTLNSIGDTYCSNCGFALDSTSAPTMVSGLNAPTLASFPGRRVTGALAASQVLGARYRIIQLVGKGGFGAVYQANDERFSGKRRVAIKEMSDAHLGQTERQRAIDNFRQEADILVDLKHPNLPDVSDFLEEGGKAYLVMEFIDGQTLEKLQENANAPLDEKQVMGWALQLCDVLEYLHTQPQPIIFRDLKPPNIMLTRTNQIKLIDFGIARVFKSSSAKDTETLGSQGYAPLEQYGRGQSDARTDIYALGATLYDLLTNTLPTASPLRRIQGLAGLRQLNPLISQGVEQVVLKAMEELPDQRYQSAAQMYDAIARMGFSIGRTTSAGLTTMSGATAATIVGGPTIAAQPGQQNTYPNQANTQQGAPTIAAGQPFQQPGTYPPSSGGGIYMPTQPGQTYIPQPPQQPGRRVSRRGLLVGGGIAILAAGTGIYLFEHNHSSATATQSGNPIQILFASSTEKQAWMQAVAQTFNASQQTWNNRPIQVAVSYFGSVDSQAQILSGQLKPVAWSPASNLEINRLNYKWQQAHSGNSIISSSEQFQPKSLVKSPLVLAAWPERAQKLLSYYHVQTLDWTTLASAFSVKNWQDVGGDQTWGPVKFGQTDPMVSNSGLLTITLLAYHYFNKERGLTKTQASDPKLWEFLNIFENAVNMFGQSTGTYLAGLIPDGPAEADVIATYENLILTLPNHPLTIYYPAVNILSDHPFAVLQGDWVTYEQKQAALIFRDYLLEVPQQQHALTYGFRPGNSNVAIDDTGVANNPFTTQTNVFASGQADSLQAQAQPPDGNVVDALITNWGQAYPNPSLANG